MSWYFFHSKHWFLAPLMFKSWLRPWKSPLKKKLSTVTHSGRSCLWFSVGFDITCTTTPGGGAPSTTFKGWQHWRRSIIPLQFAAKVVDRASVRVVYLLQRCFLLLSQFTVLVKQLNLTRSVTTLLVYHAWPLAPEDDCAVADLGVGWWGAMAPTYNL